MRGMFMTLFALLLMLSAIAAGLLLGAIYFAETTACSLLGIEPEWGCEWVTLEGLLK